MKASELIRNLSCLISWYGDKPVLFNGGDGIFREVVMFKDAGFVWGNIDNIPKNKKGNKVIYVDIDTT